MTLEETGKVMDILELAYPLYYSKLTEKKKQAALKLWASMFADDDSKFVLAAVQALIVSENKYPPNIGDVKAKIRLLTQPQEMTEMEAWALVVKAVSSTQWNYPEKQYNKLPKKIQRTLGSANTLKEWGMVDSDIFNSVTQSNFLRSYRAISERAKEIEALPNSIKTLLNGFLKKQLESAETEREIE